MFTTRNLGGVALFQFGTTFLWLTPAFSTPGCPPWQQMASLLQQPVAVGARTWAVAVAWNARAAGVCRDAEEATLVPRPSACLPDRCSIITGHGSTQP
jgi:hypothetical protein